MVDSETAVEQQCRLWGFEGGIPDLCINLTTSSALHQGDESIRSVQEGSGLYPLARYVVSEVFDKNMWSREDDTIIDRATDQDKIAGVWTKIRSLETRLDSANQLYLENVEKLMTIVAVEERIDREEERTLIALLETMHWNESVLLKDALDTYSQDSRSFIHLARTDASQQMIATQSSDSERLLGLIHARRKEMRAKRTKQLEALRASYLSAERSMRAQMHQLVHKSSPLIQMQAAEEQLYKMLYRDDGDRAAMVSNDPLHILL